MIKADLAADAATGSRPLTAVRAQVRVVPAGWSPSGDRLLASLILTPVPDATADGSLTLEQWPARVIDALKSADWTLPVWAATANASLQPPTKSQQLTATAVRLRQTWSGSGTTDLSQLVRIWSDCIVADSPSLWESLAQRLSGQAPVTTTVTGTAAEILDKAGNLSPTALPTDASAAEQVVAVSDADLALALEFERVAELLCGLSDTGASEAERRRCDAISRPPPIIDDLLDPETDAEKVQIALRERRIARYTELLQAVTGQTKNLPPSPGEPLCQNWGLRTSALPLNQIDGAFDQATAAHELVSWPAVPPESRESTKHVFDADKKAIAEAEVNAAQSYFLLAATPALARLMGLVIDVEIAREGLPEGFVLLGAALVFGDGQPAAWTLARHTAADRAFWPASCAELSLPANCPRPADFLPQVGGHLVMSCGWTVGGGLSRFDLTCLDLMGATDGEVHRRLVRGEGNGRDSAAGIDLTHGAARSSGGLTLLDRGAAMRADGRLQARIKARKGTDVPILDAEDLTQGYHLDVGVPLASGGVAWRPLGSRRIDYGPTGDTETRSLIDRKLPRLTGEFKSAERVALDSTPVTMPPRLIPFEGKSALAVGEALVTWKGPPIGIEPASAADDEPLKEVLLSFGRRIFLPRDDEADLDGLCPPSLRYGRPYRFKMRAVYAGGVAVSVDSGALLDDRLGGLVAYPPAPTDSIFQPYFRFLRHARIAAPQIAMTSDIALSQRGPMPLEEGLRAVVRSISPGAKKELRERATPLTTSRVLIPPALSQDEAERHGLFDRLVGTITRPAGGLPGIRLSQRGEGALPMTATRTRRGINGESHVLGRDSIVDGAAAGTRDPNVTLAHPVLTPGTAGSERIYHDPAAEMLVIRLRRPESTSAAPAAVGLMVVPMSFAGSAAPSPVILDVKALPHGTDPKKRRLIGLGSNRSLGAGMMGGRALEVVQIRLLPGESLLAECWAVPSVARLARDFAVIQSLGILAARQCTEAHACEGLQVGEGLKAMLLELGICATADEAAGVCSVIAGGIDNTSYVGPGGNIAPPVSVLRQLAQIVHNALLKRPIPVLASASLLEVVHATDRPAILPAFADGKPTLSRPLAVIAGDDATLAVPEGWAQTDPGARAVVIGGDLTLPLALSDGFELRAVATLPGTSVFDDPRRGRSLDSRQAGVWPDNPSAIGSKASPQSALDVFGFDVDATGRVTLPEAAVTLLRIDDLRASPDGSETNVALAPFFFRPDEPVKGSRGWRRLGLHVFPDGKARRMSLTPIAFSRTSADLTTMARADLLRLIPAESLPLGADEVPGEAWETVIPATERPAAPLALGPVPVFRTERENRDGPRPMVSMQRRATVRLRLARPWFSSGVDERLGIVLWPPQLGATTDANLAAGLVTLPDEDGKLVKLDLSRLVDADLGPGGAFVTRMGADPLHTPDSSLRWNPGVFLPLAAFRDVVDQPVNYEPRVTIPVGKDTDDDMTLTAGLLTYAPRFDPVAEEWFVDVDLNTYLLAEPFVRFGLVRFQPHAPEALRVSRPVVQWVQPLPERRFVARKAADGSLSAVVLGPGFNDGAADAGPEVHRLPVRFSLVCERSIGLAGPERVVLESKIATPRVRLLRCWRAAFSAPAPEPGSRLFMIAEEFRRARPAQYATEPLPQDAFEAVPLAESGPRFVGRLEVTGLL